MSSIIFIGSEGKLKETKKQAVVNLFLVPPYELAFRILTSLVPPFGKRFKQIYVDFLGPLFAFLVLAGILNYGYGFKTNKIFIGPVEFVLLYILFMVLACYVLTCVGGKKFYINFVELVSLIGYGMFGNVFTLAISYLCYQERSNSFFFVCLLIFGGASTLRIVLVLVKTIPFPGLRLIICSFVAIVQILTLVFLHFGYMHPTFAYGKKLHDV